jgi:hypothetical protein
MNLRYGYDTSARYLREVVDRHRLTQDMPYMGLYPGVYVYAATCECLIYPQGQIYPGILHSLAERVL